MDDLPISRPAPPPALDQGTPRPPAGGKRRPRRRPPSGADRPPAPAAAPARPAPISDPPDDTTIDILV
jgi:hypothetical protein